MEVLSVEQFPQLIAGPVVMPPNIGELVGLEDRIVGPSLDIKPNVKARLLPETDLFAFVEVIEER